jgi:hypothetical protein
VIPGNRLLGCWGSLEAEPVEAFYPDCLGWTFLEHFDGLSVTPQCPRSLAAEVLEAPVFPCPCMEISTSLRSLCSDRAGRLNVQAIGLSYLNLISVVSSILALL